VCVVLIAACVVRERTARTAGRQFNRFALTTNRASAPRADHPCTVQKLGLEKIRLSRSIASRPILRQFRRFRLLQLRQSRLSAHLVVCPADKSLLTAQWLMAFVLHFCGCGADREGRGPREGEGVMTTLVILGGVLGGAGVIAALFRAHSSRKERPLNLGVGIAVHKQRRAGDK
jgi:hypothetical protein